MLCYIVDIYACPVCHVEYWLLVFTILYLLYCVFSPYYYPYRLCFCPGSPGPGLPSTLSPLQTQATILFVSFSLLKMIFLFSFFLFFFRSLKFFSNLLIFSIFTIYNIETLLFIYLYVLFYTHTYTSYYIYIAGL